MEAYCRDERMPIKKVVPVLSRGWKKADSGCTRAGYREERFDSKRRKWQG
jgi:hypothetical protein